MAILNLGTYLPNMCGIATFSKDLRDSLTTMDREVQVAAVDQGNAPYRYPSEVAYNLKEDKRDDYRALALEVNRNNQLDLVIIQHEYGIYGGQDGEFILDFTSSLRKPYFVICHTVLPQPSLHQREVLLRLTGGAARVICMTKRSASLLSSVFQVENERISIIPHGVPAFPKRERYRLKREYGLTGRRVISTFGLIGPGKGLEIGIKAIAAVKEKHPGLLYLVAGKTHPVIARQSGESYREMLRQQVEKLGLQGHVKFVNKFLDMDQLGDLLYLTDIYLCPYPNREQAVSGTLSFAIGCGRSIVTTPYEYSLEMVGKTGCGLVASEATAGALAEQMDKILSDISLQKQLERKTAVIGQEISWPSVAKQYCNLAEVTAQQLISSGVAI